MVMRLGWYLAGAVGILKPGIAPYRGPERNVSEAGSEQGLDLSCLGLNPSSTVCFLGFLANYLNFECL